MKVFILSLKLAISMIFLQFHLTSLYISFIGMIEITDDTFIAKFDYILDNQLFQRLLIDLNLGL